jgi:integrase
VADIIHLQPAPTGLTLGAAIDAFFAATDLAATTRAVYQTTFTTLTQTVPADTPLADLDRGVLAEHLAERYGDLAPATFNRNRAAVTSLFAWCVEVDLLPASPAAGIRRRIERRSTEAERQQHPIPYGDLAAIWGDRRHRLRDRCYWTMAYDTAARATELLSLNVEDLDLANREAVTIGKGGHAERIYWSSPTARLLPRLLTGRSTGPVFLTDRRPRSHLSPAATDLCPTTGRARLSYRRAEELWAAASGGKTLHQLRHSRLTHLAEAGEDTPMLRAKSRHRSLRSLERYLNPGPAALHALSRRHDPNRREGDDR